MKTDLISSLLRLQAAIPPEEWAARVAEADRQAAILDRVVAAVAAGHTKGAALREIVPGEPAVTWLQRLQRYQAGGRAALISRRSRFSRPVKLTPEIAGFIRGLVTGRPGLRSQDIVVEIETRHGVKLAASTIRAFLHAEGLPGGKRGSKPAVAEELALAGAQLLLAVETEVGAVRELAADLSTALSLSPTPEGEVADDRANRDENGRFLPAYNQSAAKDGAEMGPKFAGVASRRATKDLTALRAATEREETTYRKTLALVMLPCLVEGARWSELAHWRGEQLGDLVGVAYQPSTLDKFARELKLAGLADVATERVAATWLSVEGRAADPVTGAVVVYGDVTTKPLWTHAFSKSAKVAKLGGRVMPAVSTAFLHSGAGTPLVYHAVSGTASMTVEAPRLLRAYEAQAGSGTARRLVVLDRESHSVALFKALTAEDWLYVIPLRRNVVGARATWKDLGPWRPYGDGGDQVQEGQLLLHDARPGETPLWTRVIGRQRHRTGKVAWYATNAPLDAFPGEHLLDLYIARWPLQEHVFRDANGRVGLDVHHGYGKTKVDNIAVLDAIERRQGGIRKQEVVAARALAEADTQASALARQQEALADATRDAQTARVAMDALAGQPATDANTWTDRYADLRDAERAANQAQETVRTLTATLDQQTARANKANATIQAHKTEIDRISKHAHIYTVDTELDQILLAFKLTFLNLCHTFLARYCDGRRLEIDTLISALFTLPGARLRTRATETIRIYRQPRDPDTMALVETACRRLTDRRLVRDHRRLIFELVDRPAT